MLCDPCPDFIISPTGRNGIGVVQPESGIDYPFVNPSDDIRELIANMILVLDSADNDKDWKKLQFPPFRVSFLAGVGCCAHFDDEGRTQPHIVIVNANNEIVFNSVPPGFEGYSPPALEKTPLFAYGAINTDYNYFEWYSGWSYCKIITYTSWPETDNNKRNWYYNLTPANAVIDARAVTIRPRSVKRLSLLWPATLCEPEQRVKLFDEFEDTNIKFKSGHNIELLTAKQAALTGVTAELTINAVGGNGLGKYNGCDGKKDFKNIVYDSRDEVVPEDPIPTPDPAIVSLNGVTTAKGDALLLLKDCLWLKKSVAIGCKRVKDEDEEPTEPADPCNPPTPEPKPIMPCEEDADGKHIKEAQVLDSDTHGHAKIGGDCVPCCECKDYEETALKMNTYASQYSLIGQRAVNVKDIHEQNVQSWRDIQSCSLNNPLRVLFVAQRCPYMDIVMLVCNPCSDACLKVKQLVLTLTNPENAVALFQPGYTAMFSSEINGRPVAIDTTTPNRFAVNFAELKRGESAYVRFRVKMTVAAEYSITGVLTGVLDDDTPIMTGCASDENQENRVPATAIVQQALQCDPDGKTTLP